MFVIMEAGSSKAFVICLDHIDPYYDGGPEKYDPDEMAIAMLPPEEVERLGVPTTCRDCERGGER